MWYTSDVREPHTDVLLTKLLDAGAVRLKDMGEVGIKMQVLSLSARALGCC